jgi:putative heme-binding domain-containing protein
LIQRQVLSPAGATFRARPAHPGGEFLVSADSWFRPVFAAEGPEDALYICDMYRKVIDHPQYLPEAVRRTADFEAGKDKGRIYRVVPDHTPAKTLATARNPRLGRLKAKQLCKALTSSNAWVRATSFRLLLERKDTSTVPLLKSFLANRLALAQTRVAALHLLDCLGELDLRTLELALADSSPGVRERALQLTETRLTNSQELAGRALSLAEDTDPRVRFQCALALGQVDGAAKMKALARIALRDGADRWTRAAVLSSIGNRAEEFFNALVGKPPESLEATAAVMTELSRIFGLSQPPEKCLAMLNQITTTVQNSELTWQPAAVEGLAEGLRSRGLTRKGLSPLQSLVCTDSAEARLGRAHLDKLLILASKTACNPEAPLNYRLGAVGVLAEAAPAQAGSVLLSLIVPAEPTAIQAAAARAAGRLADPAVVKALVSRERWRGYLPPIREAVLEVVMSESAYLPALLDGLERGDIQPWSIEPARRKQLMQHKDPSIKTRALEQFKNDLGGDRQKVYKEFRAVLNMPATAKNGHEVFKKICAQCHTYGGEGIAVGPDLTSVHNQPAEALLLHIIIPSYEIVPGYTSYDIETKDGRLLSGLIASETPTSITLKRSLGATDSILRSNIATMSSSGLSLMPDELEKTITPQELADLIAFLKGN